MDYYQLLEISPKAKHDEIKKAFKKLALKHHPDHNPNNPKAEERFKKINEAYQTLSNPRKKYWYDLRQQSAPLQPLHNPNRTSSVYREAHEQFSLNTRRLIYGLSAFVCIGFLVFAYFFHHYMNNYTARMHYEIAAEAWQERSFSLTFFHLAESMRFDDELPEVYFLRGKIFCNVYGNYEYSLSDFQKAIQYSEQPPSSYFFYRGKCYLALGKRKAALRDFEKSISLSTWQAAYHYYKGFALLQLRDKAKAKQEFRLALFLGNPFAQSYLNF